MIYFLDYNFLIVLLTSIMLGITSGILGSFAMLRKQSLVGDAMAHAALPGIVLAFLIFKQKSSLILLLGAMITGWIGILFMLWIIKNSKIKQDAALGLVLSVFFGIGLMLLTYVQKLPISNQAGLTEFLFGNAATMLFQDMQIIVILSIFVLTLVVLFWKEFKLLTFDYNYSYSLGFPVKRLEIFLNTLIVIAIVIGLQSVGVVLMSALIIAPAAASKQWTKSLFSMVLLSAFFGMFSSMFGVILGSFYSNMATGPVIVLIASFIVLLSLLLTSKSSKKFININQINDLKDKK